ncbi:hypothetical protein QVD17_20766 [Tagetes erecta]|uniref:Glycosyltransferase N-terminal domain-containing protein n=1 Tax=Tagetes erecta TaxID=13708 RepID=A0AAD8KLT7_TARER|nr:hypothetical protein QVD17_20766 [Tagetes erecta]
MSVNDSFPTTDVAIVMVPFVAQGHLTQLIHLSTTISSYNIPIHFITTTTSFHQLQSRHRTTTVNIHFHHFPVPPFTSPPPQPSTPFPTHLQPSFNSTLHLRHPTATLIRSLSEKHRRVVVIHDALMSYVVQDVVSIPNAETYVFQPPPAFYRSVSHWETTGGSFPVDLELMNTIPSLDGIASPEFMKFLELQGSHMGFYVGELYDSCRVVEGKFIEYLEKVGQKKIWAVGPFNPVRIASDSTDLVNRHKNAFLITNILKIGIAVRNWEQRDELVTSDVVAAVIKTLMGSEEGEEMRQRVMKLGDQVKESVAEGGISRMEMDSFVSYVRRL